MDTEARRKILHLFWGSNRGRPVCSQTLTEIAKVLVGLVPRPATRLAQLPIQRVTGVFDRLCGLVVSVADYKHRGPRVRFPGTP
jgi:hypothetical protein